MQKEARYRELIEEQKESGLTIKDFCSNHGIALSTFQYWKTKISRKAGRKNFIPLLVSPATPPATNENRPNPDQSNPEYDLSKDRFHVIRDPEQHFLDANRDISRQMLDKSLLIDKGNRVRLIGHPFASPEIEELFYRICNEAE